MTSFPCTQHVPKIIPTTYIGGWVRSSIRQISPKLYLSTSHYTRFHILVLGGSQGAHIFSQILPLAVQCLSKEDQETISIQQQCRPQDLTITEEAYTKTSAHVKCFTFCQDIDDMYAWCDLVICRAGASTVFELIAGHIPAILIPYPHATDQHQLKNAQVLERADAAVCLSQPNITPEILATSIHEILHTPKCLKHMSDAYESLDTINIESLFQTLPQFFPPSTSRFLFEKGEKNDHI